MYSDLAVSQKDSPQWLPIATSQEIATERIGLFRYFRCWLM
jgi:hypothetical protein